MQFSTILASVGINIQKHPSIATQIGFDIFWQVFDWLDGF